MKILLVMAILITLTLSLCSVSTAQPPVTVVYADTTAATTAWDSVYIGPPNFSKYVKVTNQNPTGVLLFALGNDTAAGRIIFLRPGQSKIFQYGILEKHFVRTKASTGTMLRYVESEY